jgi:hypothetical protein
MLPLLFSPFLDLEWKFLPFRGINLTVDKPFSIKAMASSEVAAVRSQIAFHDRLKGFAHQVIAHGNICIG